MQTKHIAMLALVVLAAFVGAAAPAAAQTTTETATETNTTTTATETTEASETTTVRDGSSTVRFIVDGPNGSWVTDATVTLKQNGTTVATTTTDVAGVARIDNLEPGTYTVEITNSEYEPVVASGVTVEDGETADYRVTMGTTNGGGGTVESVDSGSTTEAVGGAIVSLGVGFVLWRLRR